MDQLAQWRADGHRVVLARVVGVDGSAPRDAGAAMAVNDAGEIIGSVSGGCVEGSVVGEAERLLAGERGAGIVTFGYSDDEAFAVGLTCGGTVHLFLETLVTMGDVFDALHEAVRTGQPGTLVTVVEGEGVGAAMMIGTTGRIAGSLGNADLDRVVARDAVGELGAGLTVTRHYGPCGEARERDVGVFMHSFGSPPRLVIFGAVDFTAALASVGKLLGFHVTVCDARAAFATEKRFPTADAVVNDWPNRYLSTLEGLGERDAICVLTHDAKFDVPAIVGALATEVGYIGAMGSRRTHEARVQRLREAGVDDGGLARVMSPIGLDLGARTPEETAVAIAAEIIARRTGRAAPSLRDSDGPIH